MFKNWHKNIIALLKLDIKYFYTDQVEFVAIFKLHKMTLFFILGSGSQPERNPAKLLCIICSMLGTVTISVHAWYLLARQEACQSGAPREHTTDSNKIRLGWKCKPVSNTPAY